MGSGGRQIDSETFTGSADDCDGNAATAAAKRVIAAQTRPWGGFGVTSSKTAAAAETLAARDEFTRTGDPDPR